MQLQRFDWFSSHAQEIAIIKFLVILAKQNQQDLENIS